MGDAPGPPHAGLHHLLGVPADRQSLTLALIALNGLPFFVLIALAFPIGCALQPASIDSAQAIDVAFSPEAGAEVCRAGLQARLSATTGRYVTVAKKGRACAGSNSSP